MTIDEFDALHASAATAMVRVWADVPRWASELVGARPFETVDALSVRAEQSAYSWTDDEVMRALAHHPRIGEQPTGASATAAASRREQAASANSDDTTTAALHDGNIAYEARFGHVFLIRAAGRTSAEILAELTRRLGNDDETERRETATALREIAMLRLQTELQEGHA